MKLLIDNDVDALYLKFNNNKVCKIYIEEESIQYDLVQNFIQDEVDFIIKHR